MNKPIKVILLDDDAKEIFPDLSTNAKLHRVLITEAFTNSEEGIEFIRKNHDQFDAIILDGFFLTRSDSSKKKDKSALKKTIDELTKILLKEHIKIPFCIFTGYLNDINEDSISSDIQVFNKHNPTHAKKMYDYLKAEVAKNDVYQIKNEFEEIFELFEKDLFPEDKEDDLVEILKKLKNKAKYNHDDAFNPIRKMYEATINELHDQVYGINKKQDIVHEKLYNDNSQLSILWSWFYLSGKEVRKDGIEIIPARVDAVWPPHVSNIVKAMIDIFQENSHDYPEDVHHYTYKSVVYALLELLLWYKNFITDYSKTYSR